VHLPAVEQEIGDVDMGGFIKKSALAVSIMAFAVQPAQACWDDAAQDAAKISNLNMMLMVTALRCRGGQDNFLAQYNKFVRANNALLGSQNSLIRTHFAKAMGAKGAESALDKLATGYANSYGAGHPNMGCKELKALATRVADEKQGVASLSSIAYRVVGNSTLPGGRCTTSIASRK
jgi:hypothetical protein